MKKDSQNTSKKTIFNSSKLLVGFALLFVSLIITTVFVQQRQDVRQRAQAVPTPAPVSINIVDFQYNPGTVTVQVGTRVTWTNRSTQNVPHTVTSDVSGSAQSWDSQTINPGGTFSRTFSTPGTYTYHCNVHGQSMSGQIIVIPQSTQLSPTSLPSPSSGTPSTVQPTYACLGACPTPTPSIKPTLPYQTPSPTPTTNPYPSPTVKPTIKPYASPTLKPTAVVYPTTTPKPTLAPCPVEYATTADEHDAHAADNVVAGDKNFFSKFLEFIIELFFKLLEFFFGYQRPGTPGITPTPGYPTTTINPSGTYPTVSGIEGSPTTEPTLAPTFWPTTTPGYRVSPTRNPYPTKAVTPSIYKTPAPTYYYSPTPKPSVAPYISPTPPCATPTPSPTPTTAPGYPTPTETIPTPTPSGVSVDTFRYVEGNEPLKEYTLTAEVVGDKWLFNKSLPGPTIEANEGDHLKINLHNLLPEALTVHWHGIMLPASQDGVAGITQDAVKPGASYTYDYVVPDVGTYWYHSHQNTSQQLPKGLFGALIVSPKQAEPYDHDYNVIYRNTEPVTEQFVALPGETVRVRMTNSRVGDSAGTPVILAPIGVPFKVIALDGQNVNGPQEISDQLLHIGFAQRYDIAFTMPASGMVQIADKEGLQTLNFGTGALSAPANLNTLPVFSFMDYGVPTADKRLPRNTFDVEKTLEIGPNLTINGQLGHNIPDLVVKDGQIAKIKYINNSNMTHPMHLHGHFYSVISFNGKKPTGSPIHLDTILLAPGDTAEVAFLADNPGVWMLHCHILSHAAAGLSMMVTYDGVYTPYKIGGNSGNQPE